MSEFKCPFCGSDELKVEQPHMVKKKLMEWGSTDGMYEKETAYCCKAQATNQKYKEAKYHPTRGEKPSDEEIAKW